MKQEDHDGPASLTWIMQWDWDAYHNNFFLPKKIQQNYLEIGQIFGEENFKVFNITI